MYEIVKLFEQLSLEDQHKIVSTLTKKLGRGDRKANKTQIEGKVGEDFIDKIMNDELLIEVKTEAGKYLDTGNIYIEDMQYDAHTGEDEISGILTTESDIWSTVFLDENKQPCGVIFLLTSRLKELYDEYHRNTKYLAGKHKCSNGSASSGIKVPINDYFKLNKKK
jgi:hypothetical protein